MLSGLLPNATVGRDKVAGTLVISATEEDHAQVVEFLKSYDVEPDDGKTTQVYEQKNADVDKLSEILNQVLPDAKVFGSADLQAIVLTAKPEDHQRASELMERFQNNQKGRDTRVIHLDKSSAQSVVQSLAGLVPEANVVADQGSNSILATGSAEDLARIEKVVGQIEDAENSGNEIRVFPLGTADARYVDAAILALDGVESAVAERETNSLIVVAPKETMETVTTVIEEIKKASPKESVTKVFRLENSDARYIDNAILAIEGVIGAVADRDSNSVIVTAPKEVMARVDSVVEQIESDQHKDHETKVFKLTYADPRYIDSAVLAIADNVSAVADRATNSLIVTASKADMARIAAVVEQIDKRELTERTTTFYKVDASEPSSLASALADNFPEATLTADESAGGIFATATKEEHEAIAVVVENLSEQPSRMPTLKTFVLKHAHVPTTADAIESAFGLSSDVGVGFHEESSSIFVVGTAQDLEIAAALVEQIDQSKSLGEGRLLKTFPVSQVDGNSLVPIIQSLFRDEQPRLEVRYDGFARELYTTGTPPQLKRVEETLTQLSGPERELVVMQLRELDTFTFRSAVDALFRDQPARMLPNISMDQAQQIVMIRATAEQHEKIRALAKQMGEEAAEIQGGMHQAKSSR
ncbi:MAG: secretin N-terminal domain-containing protein, partial [Planctomycetota bacterium]